MTRFYNIALSVCILYSVLRTPLMAQDYARMGERTIDGTARYVGMGGAMSAIGGDPSAAHDNIAGLGLYRRSEVLLTAQTALDRTQARGNNYVTHKNVVTCPQASIVIGLPTYKEGDKGIQFNNILFSYRRLRTFNREIYATSATPSPSLGALIQTADVDIPFCAEPYNASSALLLKESGAASEFNIGWAMNISNQWYVGAGVQFLSYSLSSRTEYSETFDMINYQRQHMTNRNNATLVMTGAGVAGSVGIIYRPFVWLRLGFGLQTASIGSLRYYTSGALTALTDSLLSSYAPELNYSVSDFHMPWHTSTSAAFQIGAWAMISLQYDYFHQKNEYDIHSLRAGFEVIPILGMYINGGYAYESSFKKNLRVVEMDPTFDRQDTHFLHPKGGHYASIAMGYRGTHVVAQLAYQYHFQGLSLWTHQNADPYDIDTQTHKIVLTIGWHRYY